MQQFNIYNKHGFHIIIGMKIEKVFIASDHGGYDLKKAVVDWLKKEKITFEDLGPYNNDCSVDYPDFAEKVCSSIQQQGDCCGILICGSGLGVSMAANKMKGIRAALCSETLSAELSRLHNNANVLCLGGRLIGNEMAQNIILTFLNTPFDGGRHLRRINKIHMLEGK